MKNIFNWFINQKTWVKVFIIITVLGLIGMLIPESPEDIQKKKLQAMTKIERDSIESLPYFKKPEAEKRKIVEDAFGGLYAPQWIQLEKTVKNQFKFPEETEVDSPKQYGISNLDSGFVWFSTEVHSKNAFGVKTTNILKAQYRIDKDGKLFYCYHYFVE